MTAQIQQKRRMSARECAVRTGVSKRHVCRRVALIRDEYIAETAREHEAINAFHDDDGSSWTQTAQHFRLHLKTVQQRAYRAREEHSAERAEAERISGETKDISLCKEEMGEH